MSAKLAVIGLEVRFDDSVVLSGIDIEVGEGEIVALLGPSGCGKTTLLRSIAGLVEPNAGSIELAGLDLISVPTHKRDIGLMFQDHALFPHLSVAANVAFGLEMAGMASSNATSRVADVLELVGLHGFGTRRIQDLSGGEAQRVALARALAPQPTLLMLDEPLGSLDRTLREELAAELRSVITKLGITALHVTHDQSEAFTVADRIAVMNGGEIEAFGEPEELWRNPPTAFAARFLGHANLVEHPSVNDGRLTLIPVPALSLAEGAAAGRINLTVSIERSEFAEGRWRHTSRGPHPLTFMTSHRLGVGAEVLLVVDDKQLREITD